MDYGEYAEYVRKQGRTVVRTEACYWARYRPFFYHAIPIVKEYSMPRNIERTMLLKHSPAGLFYLTEGIGNGKLELLVIDNKDYGLHILNGKTRNQVRRGIERCEVKKMNFADLNKEGLRINQDALARQKRRGLTVLTDKRLWENRMNSCSDTRDVEAFAAYSDGEMAAYAICARISDFVVIQSTMSRTSLLSKYPNNALIFTIISSYMQQEDVKWITYGFDSKIDEGVSRFKINMGFKGKEVNKRMILNPAIKLLIKRNDGYRYYLGAG